MYIKEEASNTIVIEKSKFIAYLTPCFSEQEYKNYLKFLKKKHYDASHVCSGFIHNNIKRSSDDGEPSGTAGIPILSTLEKRKINHTAAFVVRYFGGIKLGAGGLIRAYGQAISEALNVSKLVEDVTYKKYEIVLPYELANKINNILEKEAINLQKEYGEEVKYLFLTNDDSLLSKIQELTSGFMPSFVGEEQIQKDV